MHHRLALFALVPLVLASPAGGDAFPIPGGFHPDGHGGSVYFPLGDLSFADAAVSYQAGDPPPRDAKDRDPGRALGPPDFDDGSDTGYLTLGCGGSVVLRFEDNALVDTRGPDLHVFEIGGAIEPTDLSISANGRDWLDVGRIEGGRADVDLAGRIRPGEIFRYVRLTDLRSNCDEVTPGADIDAVGAIGSGLRLRLESGVLFDFGKAALKPAARGALEGVARRIRDARGARVVVAGHTDSVGSEADNQALSLRRAAGVRGFLVTATGLPPSQIEARGHGESRPVASNDTEAGRQENRRVEVIVIPEAPGAAAGEAAGGRFDGMWDTSEGVMVIRSGARGRVYALYATDRGRLLLDADGATLRGHWVEQDSSRRCDGPRDGSVHWGRIELVFDASFRRFSGWWSYCESSEQAGTWEGTRRE